MLPVFNSDRNYLMCFLVSLPFASNFLLSLTSPIPTILAFPFNFLNPVVIHPLCKGFYTKQSLSRVKNSPRNRKARKSLFHRKIFVTRQRTCPLVPCLTICCTGLQPEQKEQRVPSHCPVCKLQFPNPSCLRRMCS